MKRTLCGVGLAALCLMGATSALAGIADSPLPVLQAGATTQFLYSVPGVVNNGILATVFICTSTDTATMQVGVEVFGDFGGAPANDATATSLSVAPGATVNFRTGALVWLGGNSSSLIPGPVESGSARILATSKKLTCTAFLADPSNAPPTSMVYLTIIAKLKQKAAN